MIDGVQGAESLGKSRNTYDVGHWAQSAPTLMPMKRASGRLVSSVVSKTRHIVSGFVHNWSEPGVEVGLEVLGVGHVEKGMRQPFGIVPDHHGALMRANGEGP